MLIADPEKSRRSSGQAVSGWLLIWPETEFRICSISLGAQQRQVGKATTEGQTRNCEILIYRTRWSWFKVSQTFRSKAPKLQLSLELFQPALPSSSLQPPRICFRPKLPPHAHNLEIVPMRSVPPNRPWTGPDRLMPVPAVAKLCLLSRLMGAANSFDICVRDGCLAGREPVV